MHPRPHPLAEIGCVSGVQMGCSTCSAFIVFFLINQLALETTFVGPTPTQDLPLKNPFVFPKLVSFVRNKHGMEIQHLHFNGQRIDDTQTPADLGLQDNDVIEARCG